MEVLLQIFSAAMTEPERKDTYVAVVPAGGDAWAQQKAIFQARTVNDRLAQISDAWLFDVLRRDSIRIFLHPLVETSAQGARIFGYECLMRGVDASGALIPPGKMLAAARSLDMLFLLDQKCRLAAVRKAAEVAHKVPPETMFFINFLPTAIYNPEHCLQTTMAAVGSSGLRPEQICFEVVETEDVGDRKHLINILSYYRDRGFKVALDDVGAGYSSLMALSDLRPHFIKLDGELVRKAAQNPLEGKIVRDLAMTMREAGIVCLAEGVETAEQLRFVIDCGISLTQGYVHCKPLPDPLDEAAAQALLQRVDVARRSAA